MTNSQKNSPVGVDHTGFVVPNLNEAVSFFTEYCDASVAFTLGPVTDSSGESVARIGAVKGATFALAMLDFADTRIELLQWWPCLGVTPSVPNVSGASHLALTVANVANFLQRVQSVPGVRILSTPLTFTEGPTPGMTNAFIIAPWGLLIEVVSWA